MSLRLLIILVLPIFFGCKDESLSVTIINLKTSAEGLKTTLSGKAINQNHPITELNIDWGDDGAKTIIKSDFDSVLETHKYGNEGEYNIIASATNILGDTTNRHYSILVSFNETSLVGIRESLYKQVDNEFLFLTINLHTYQEKDQAEKFNMLIDVIGQMDIDFIALQECAQHKSAALIDNSIREDNMAHLIALGVQKKYNTSYDYIWDWSHYGWNVWEEGVAVLSKYPIIEQESRYISRATSVNNIESRKVIYGACQLPDGKKINLFSTHLHWRKTLTDQEQNKQIQNLQTMVNEKSALNSYSFVAGDFNVNPTSEAPWSEGYFKMIDNDNYTDLYLLANADANAKPAQSQHHTVLGSFPGRIDYIFMKSNPDFMVIDAQILFRPDIVGVVSDHYGVITKVKLVN